MPFRGRDGGVPLQLQSVVMLFRGGNGGVLLQRVVYYAILLLLILGELLREINYIIIIFPEYDSLLL